MYYKPGSSVDDDCHRGHGSSGYFGADGTECDAPLSLVDATLRWIDRNLKDKIDFVVWTGDSARHDKDEKIPREMEEIVQLNEIVTKRFLDVFQKESSPIGRPSIPIIPTFGNNDIMPHNTMTEGPNRWTKSFLEVWKKLIPESQRHSFIEGGWFTTEVIPGKLAVISLNTMYFYSSNSAVDGCNGKSEPGYEHMEWLKIQLKLLRERKMKAILIGHVAPARAGSKIAWEESCWQKYTLWMNRYRDVIVGSVYGHMNIDHFMLQDSHDVDILSLTSTSSSTNGNMSDPNFSVQSNTGYLEALRDQWSDMPSPPAGFSFGEDDGSDFNTDKSKKKKKRFLKKIGGPFAERYSLSLVSPSVVPNFYPTIRVFEYNITGLEDMPTWNQGQGDSQSGILPYLDSEELPIEETKKNKKKKKKPKFEIPEPPPSSTLPGPAYSNQPFSWLSYTQYYADITKINEQIANSLDHDDNNTNVDDYFGFEVEYDTRVDPIYKMKDLTVRSFYDLATRVADNKRITLADYAEENDNHVDEQKKKKKNKKNKKLRDRVWRAFLDRAFVGYYNNTDDLDD